MPAKHRTVRRQKSQPARRIRGSILPSGRRSLYEQLEDRRVLDGTYFDTLADDVAGSQGALQTITSALQSVQSAVNLPLINQPLQKITQITTSLESFQSALSSALHNLKPGVTNSDITMAIFDAIGPNSTVNVLQPHADGTPAVMSDISVTNNSGGGFDVSLNLGYQTNEVSAPAGLGINSIPFQPASGTNGSFVVGVSYQHFDFGYNPSSGGAYFGTDPNSALQLTFTGNLPSTFTAGLGFMNVSVTQNPPAPNQQPTPDLALTISSNVSGGIGNNEGSLGISDPTLSGALHLDKHFLVQINGNGMPELQGDLELGWTLPNIGASAPVGGWGAPTFALNSVQLEVGSLLGSLVQPLAQDIKSIMDPLEPVFNVLNERIPGISDMVEALGGSPVTLLSLDTILSALPDPPTGLLNAINSIVTIRNYVDTIDEVASAAAGGWINIGDFQISGKSSPSLLTEVAAQLGASVPDWSNLVSVSGDGVNYDGIKQEIRSLLGDTVGGEVDALFDQVTGSGDGGGMQFTYPIVTDPSSVALGLLLGQDAPMVTFSDDLDQPFDDSFPIQIIPGFNLYITAKADIHVKVDVGYDTQGLRDAIAPLYHGNNFDFSKILDGLYIGSDTDANVSGTVGAGPQLGLPIAEVGGDGTLTATLDAKIHNPTGTDKIRPFIPADLDGTLFDVSGSLVAGLDVYVKVGVDTPLGFIGFDKTWNFDQTTLYQFNTATIPVPAALVPPPPQTISLFTYDASTKTLILNAGPYGSLRNDAPDGNVQENENFTVTHVSHFNFAGFPSSGGRIIFDEFQISDGSTTQLFNGGEVDRVYADMGTGNDSLVVVDTEGGTYYQIYGGDGDDNIDVQGNVQVQIDGGAGNDTIDAGNGTSSDLANTVNGGPGNDTITFGSGDLTNVNPLAVWEIVKDPGDTSRDKIVLDNSRSRDATQYYFYQNVAGFDYEAQVDDVAGSADVDRDFYMSQYDEVNVYGGSSSDQFFGTPPEYSTLSGGAGDDSFELDYLNPGVLPVAPILNIPGIVYLVPTITLLGGAGDDYLEADDELSPDTRSWVMSPDSAPDAQATLEVTDNDGNGYNYDVGGIEETNLAVGQSSEIRVDGWSEGTIDLTAGTVQMNANDSVLWNSNVDITNTPTVYIVDPDPTNQFSIAGIDSQGAFIRTQQGFESRLNADPVTKNFVFQVSQAIVDLSPALLAKPWIYSFDSNDNATLLVTSSDPYALPTTDGNYNFFLLPNLLLINTSVVPLSGIVSLTINSGTGNDSFYVAGSTPNPISLTFDGGAGQNSFTADDSTNNADDIWLLQPNFVTNYAKYSISLKNINSMDILSGGGADQVEIIGSYTYPVTVDTGAGNDNVSIGVAGSPPVSFGAPTEIDGGQGDDTFTLTGATNATNLIGGIGGTNQLTINGGIGDNSLILNDKKQSGTLYNIYSNRISDMPGGGTGWLDFMYAEMGSVEIDMGDGMDSTQVWGTSSDITGFFTLNGNGGNDGFTVRPRDTSGNPTINGALQINGGLGSDNVAVDNSASTVGEHYTLSALPSQTLLSSQSIIDLLLGNDIELLDLRGGSGDDQFDVDDYYTDTMQLDVEGNAGNDTVTLAASEGILDYTISPTANMTFAGGSGTNSFDLSNIESIGSWSYTRVGDQITAASATTGYSLTIKPFDFENMTIDAGSSADNFYVETLGTGESLTLNGNGGLDNFNIADQFENTQLIDGQIIVDGGDDGGNLSLDDSANTSGAVVHVDPMAVGTIGAAPGDTLFGSGGSLDFSNLADDAGDNTIALAMGTGADTVYAGPMPNAVLSISGNGPLGTVPGDALHVSLVGVQNPVQRTFGGGNGEFTSDNRKNMFWSNFEALTTDYVPTPSFLVTNTLDSGPGSLRQAILNANASPNAAAPDVIRFAIPGVGAHTIQPLSQLPGITDPVVIDGTTQPGYAGTPVIELDGSLAGVSDGLDIFSGSTTIRGLDIHSFVGTPSGLIYMTGPGGNVIQGNYLGTNLAGNAIYPLASQGSYGVVIFGSSNNVIGTDGDGVNDAAEGNVISGNNTAGVLIELGQPGQTSNSNVIAGNLLGTSADGNTALPNGRMGVFLLSGSGNRIGTNSDGISDAAERNLISGNAEDGIFLGGNGNLVAGNLIGTNLAGTAALPNAAGITVQNASNNMIGATSAGAGNVIANNTLFGVWIGGGTGNSVLSNSIYNNGRLGIDLSASTDPANGVTPNDAGDTDTGSNNLQNYPQISTALASSTQTTLGGTLQSTPQSTFRVEFFASAVADPSGYGEGQTYLGSTSVTTDITGMASFVASLATGVPVGQFISATATDPAGNTSEFSLSVPVVASSSQTNVAMLRVPGTNAPFLISSPVGTTITASVSSTAGATPPSGLAFPFGFVTFQVNGVAAGAAANVTLTGLDVSQIAQYYKYGPTPATHANHWYDFLYNQATDSDSAVGTGMQITGGTIVLHLIDGKRGDDDLTANGVITDIGGPVQNHPPKAGNDSASTYKNVPVTVNVLANDSDSDGTLNPASVAVVGAAAHGTTSINSTTGAITYTPAANYTGADSFTYKVKDNNGADSNVATVSITVLATGSISGTEFLDVTGNGASADDTPMSGVNVFLDTNNNGTWNTGEPTTTTLADGSYTFANLPAGNYVVRQVTPAGYIRTAPATTDNYAVSLAVGQVVSGDNFANAALGNPAALANIVYVINGVTPVSDLRGTTHEGDTVQVTFTVVAGAPAQRFTLVSYTAPGATYDATKAAQQQIFQTATGVFGPGTYTLSVSNPHSYFQVDFVSGSAIDHFGASNSNIFYSSQNRLFSADNGGTHAVLSSPASLTGEVYRDTNNNGVVDAGEQPISGIKVTATAGSTTQTVVTDIRGVYRFDNLPAGTYTVTETQSSDYTDGKDTLGNKGGTASNDKFSGIVLASGAAATGYNFGEQQVQGAAVAANQTQTLAWWNGSSGQALIKAVSGGANAKTLGNWLATTYSNLFGSASGSANNLAGKTNTQVAAFYQSLYSNTAKKAETDALALAFAVYVTNSGLAGTTATSYGFAVSATGLGASTMSVGINGVAFGVDNNALLTVAELLSRTNARTSKGIVWDANGDGSLSAAEGALRNQVTTLFDSINNL